MYSYVPHTNNRYMASTYGNIYDFKMNKYVNLQKHKRGWYRGHFWIDNVRKTIGWHRIIALTFIGDLELTVNHINGVKEDNSIYNLEYATKAYQSYHRSRELYTGTQKRIYCVETGDIFPNAVIATEVLNIPKTSVSHIRKAANNKCGFRTVNNYSFKKVD